MKLQGIWKSTVTALLCMLVTPVLSGPADQYVEEARRLSAQGDLKNAAVSYQKALKLDQNHGVARKELRTLMLEAHRKNPQEEITEAELGLLQDKDLKETGGIDLGITDKDLKETNAIDLGIIDKGLKEADASELETIDEEGD